MALVGSSSGKGKVAREVISEKGEFKEADFNEFLIETEKLHEHGVVVAIMGPQNSESHSAMSPSPALVTSSAMKLISGAGEFNHTGFEDFLRTSHVDHEHGVVVAILGPQSSGKSTLMNHLFSTNFEEMNAKKDISRTTNGLWLQKASDIKLPFTIVLDLEGTDSQERGQDDKVFEKQSALFALVIADIVFINIPYCNVGLEEGANRPLLRTIFEVMLRLFSPRKITLHFIVRDKSTKLPFEKLEEKLKKGVEKLWEAVPKPCGREKSHLSEFFNVEVTALSNYEWALHLFKEEIVHLRKRIYSSTSARSLVGESEEFSFNSAKSIWDNIKQHKDLNVPPHKVMLSTVRCEEIVIQNLRLFQSNEVLVELQEVVKTKLVNGFGTKISSILGECLLSYDTETQYYEKDVRKAKREYLESQALEVIHPLYVKTLDHLHCEALQKFEDLLQACLNNGKGFAESVRTCRELCVFHFEQQCLVHAEIPQSNWDASTVSKELLLDVHTHSLLVRKRMLPPILDAQKEILCRKLSSKVKSYFTKKGNIDIWGCIRSLEKEESDRIPAYLYYAFHMFDLDHATIEPMVRELKQYARKFVVTRFKEETRDVRVLLQGRFVIALEENGFESNAKKCTKKANHEEAYNKCLKLLSTVAVIRLEGFDDNVESVLLSGLKNKKSDDINFGPYHHLSSTTWEEVPPEMTLITPLGCTELWKVFKRDMEHLLKKSEAEVWSLPYWATVGVNVLTSNQFFRLLSTWGVDVSLLGELVKAGITIIREWLPVDAFISLMNGEFVQGVVTEFRRAHRKIMRTFKKWLMQVYRSMAKGAGNSPLLITA